LTPERIEAVLGDFRSWLQHVAAAPPAPPDAEPAETVDLHTLLGQFIALRHEVNLQTRATRAQQEQNAATLDQFGQALDVLRQSQAPGQRDDKETESLRPLLRTLIDVHDALLLAAREVQRLSETILSSLDELAAPPARTSLWARWFLRSNDVSNQGLIAKRVRQMLESVATGYTMSVQRAERALQQAGLEPISCIGEAFDPEQMEVVATVSDSDRPAGEVVQEVRRGYLWNGRVFRFAQVSVAKP
jgi:molecular chaperone GrpE